MLVQWFATWLWHILPERLSWSSPARGQGLVEYAMILVLVAIIVIIILATVGTTVRDVLYQNIIDAI